MKFVLSVASIALYSCTSLSSRPSQSLESISLGAVQSVDLEKTTAQDLTRVFGTPLKVIKNPLPEVEVWLYSVEYQGEMMSRASFTVSTLSQRVLGSVWIPMISESFANQDAVLAYFSKIQFRKKSVQQSSYWRGSDWEFEDLAGSISFKVQGATGKVQAITFGLPIARRLSGY